MTAICHICALVVGACNCRYHVFIRRLDEWIDDWNREQASMPSMANCKQEGTYR